MRRKGYGETDEKDGKWKRLVEEMKEVEMGL